MADLYGANVVTLLHFDETPGATGFADSGSPPNVFTRVGTATTSAASAKFGGKSLLLAGGSDSVRAVGNANYAFGTGDFTVECFISPQGFTNEAILDFFGSSGWRLSIAPLGWYLQWSTADSVITGDVFIGDAAWHHVAVSRSAGVLYLFTDGTMLGTGTPSTENLASVQAYLGIGAEASTPTTLTGFTGYIDEVRITKGVGRYTANFTSPTEPFTTTLPDVLTAPMPSVKGFFGASLAVAAPSPTVLSHFLIHASAAVGSPSPSLFAKGRNSQGDNSFVYTAPRATLSAFGGATAKLKPPSPALSITATVVNFGRAEIKPPAPTLSGTGTVSGTAYADLTFGFSNGGSYSLIGYGGAVASITLTGSPTIQATGTSGSIGGAQITAPLFELTASGTARNYGSALLVAPAGRLGGTARAWLMAPSATLTAIGSAVVVATYEAYAVNLNHTPKRGVEPVDETTRYTNFPFTHVVRYKNSYFGANATGLYLLEGTTDDGADISYALKTTTSDLDSPNQKTVASAYFSGRLGPDAAVTLYAGEGAGVPYTYTTPRGALAQNHRQVFGKGIKSHRYYALGLSGSDVLELDNVELDVKQMNRRI